MNLTGKPPLGLKQPKPEKPKPKRMRGKSKKKAQHEASAEGKSEARYLEMVGMMPCCACGRHAPSEAHHCRDAPPKDEAGIYVRLPGAALKSSDYDAIPLCPPCHRMFHEDRSEFHARYGRDYTRIAETRKRCGYSPNKTQ